ncbi:MAG: stage V sporulation protein AA [Clostridia bacterium]|nr:stage V sporulation protein AA [Clostridia bacterium]
MYLKPNKIVYCEDGVQLRLKDLAQVLADRQVQEDIERLTVITSNFAQQSYMVLSSLELIKVVNTYDNNLKVNIIGNTETMLKKAQSNRQDNVLAYLKLAVVIILIFLGAGYSIMYFHADVNMFDMHKKLCKMVTGNANNILMIQIPYSLGLGLGLSLFFNHLTGKKLTSDPSPLEVEMYLYSDNIDKYMKDNS